MEDVFQILKILGIGAIITAFFNYVFHLLSLKRQFQHALEQKMIERISDLVEQYYGQIANASGTLRSALRQTLLAKRKGRDVAAARKMCFYLLVIYFHHLERLRHERPVPLFTEIKAERKYVLQFREIYRNLQFNYYDVSFMLSRLRTGKELRAGHLFVELIENEEGLKRCYGKFSDWFNECRCDAVIDENCQVHKVIRNCKKICKILDEQTKKMYSIWYDQPKKPPKKVD